MDELAVFVVFHGCGVFVRTCSRQFQTCPRPWGPFKLARQAGLQSGRAQSVIGRNGLGVTVNFIREIQNPMMNFEFQHRSGATRGLGIELAYSHNKIGGMTIARDTAEFTS